MNMSNSLFILCSHVWICFNLFVQDLPGVISDEELSRRMHLKELNDRPYRCQAVSAYDG
jgi:hypothetical protein